jgi:hypothetical protein
MPALTASLSLDSLASASLLVALSADNQPPTCAAIYLRYRAPYYGRTMKKLFDILKKDRDGTFQWMEGVNDIETAKTRLGQLSAESTDEFVVFRNIDLRVVASSRTAESFQQTPVTPHRAHSWRAAR